MKAVRRDEQLCNDAVPMSRAQEIINLLFAKTTTGAVLTCLTILLLFTSIYRVRDRVDAS
jgi:hypothetical protein